MKKRVVGKNVHPRAAQRLRVKDRIKKKWKRLQSDLPRLVVFKSNKFIYAQIVDDLKQETIVSASSFEKAVNSGSKSAKTVEHSKQVGKLIAERFSEKCKDTDKKVFFDRNGFNYHGKVRALAESARESGLVF